MSCRNASSSSRRSESSLEGASIASSSSADDAASDDRRAGGSAGRERRDLVAQGDQVVVLRRELAELLLLGQRLAEERPGDVEVAAQRVEAGEVVAGVGGGPRRPAAAVDDRGDRRRRARGSATRGRPPAAIGVRWVSVCSEPLPMIVPLIRGRASVSSLAASISATSSSVVASASARTSCHDHAARSAWNLAFASSVSTSIGSLAPIAERAQPIDGPTLPRVQMRLDVLRRPAAVGAPARRERPASSAARTSRSAARAARMPSISPARRPAAFMSVSFMARWYPAATRCHSWVAA